MRLRTTRLYMRRQIRRQRRRLEEVSRHTGELFEKDFLGRLGRLKAVWRFTLVWVLLFVLLGGCLVTQLTALRSYYQVISPVPGGIYSEGMEGSFTTANPLYAVSDIDTSVAKLLFSSLLTYDSQNHLTGDLADRWTVNDAGTIYTVHLRPNLVWHDGRPLTADDVVFTYQTIQNPDAQSPLRSSWQNVSVTAINNRTVSFTLPNPLSSFPYSLTNGIVPKHILQAINVADLRSTSFNTADPIGAGPFRWGSLGQSGGDPATTEEQISLVPFAQYWAGAPKLSSFSIHAFASHEAMLKAYRDRAITALVGLDSAPADIAKDNSTYIYNLPLTAAVFTFFKTSNPILQDPKVRQALVWAADRGSAIQRLDYPAIPADEPLLRGQLGYDRAYIQTTNKPSQARALLDSDGWSVGVNGIRTKNGQPLTFALYETNDSEYARIATLLRNQWRDIGVDVKVVPQQPADFQGTLSSHAYDAVLYGVSIGVDPDVFVYWDSSQADIRSANRLNFSEYKSTTADVALEAGRTRLDSQLRAVKYKTFLQAWQQDVPALALYQPRLLYISHVQVHGLGENQINTDADRYNNVQDWMIHTGWVTR